jgi:NTP pyrophosphatase (non-canonical NTP hydrolase)
VVLAFPMLAAALRNLSIDVQAVYRRYVAHYQLVTDDAWFVLKLGEEVGELVRAFVRLRDRPLAAEERRALEDNFAEECADVLCMLILVAARNGVDLATAVEKKWLSRLATPAPAG